MKIPFFILLASILPSPALANSACGLLGGASVESPVIYFGGWKASESDGQKWAQAAKSTAARYCPGKFGFEGHGLQNAESSQSSVVSKNAEAIQSCIKKIQAYSGGQKITLVGHSDGSWAVNAIVNGLSKTDRAKVNLVELDGNLQSSWGPEGPPASVICYTPSAKPTTSCEQIHWPSHREGSPPYTKEMMNGICAGHCRPITTGAEQCPQNLWHAHFSLVSSNASCGLNTLNFNETAYQSSMSPPLNFLGCEAVAPGVGLPGSTP
jgi:hypothetical protein